MASSRVQFTLNGELQTVDVEEALGKTLNEYIRTSTNFTATKVSCAQGGCGACTVALARPTEKLVSAASCITPLVSVHGAAVLTAEGLASPEGKPHPVSERLARFNGSQCGFCTPGMVMQLYSTLSNSDGGKAASEKDLEHCINGNICRCTGYRPIVECAKSFAADTKVTNQVDPSATVGPYDAGAADPKLVFPPAASPSLGPRLLRPSSLQEAADSISVGATPLAGGTGGGVYPELHPAAAGDQSFVDLLAVPELRGMEVVGPLLRIGAATTWTAFCEGLQDLLATGRSELNKEALLELKMRCGHIAGNQVRNRGTLGGNIALTRDRNFISDWVPPLAALGASVETISAGTTTREQEPLLAFVQKNDPFKGLITGVFLPLPSRSVVFRSFRLAQRSRNAHAFINAGFAASQEAGRVSQATVVLGVEQEGERGVALVRMKNLERALGGVKADDFQTGLASVTTSLCEKVKADLFPISPEIGREQAEHIVGGFVFKFLTALFGESLPKQWQSAGYCLHDQERSTSAAQTFPPPTDLKGPLNKPMTKTTALEQTMGRAKFVDDMPMPEGTLVAALVLCPEANVTVTDIDVGRAKELLGEDFHSLVTAADLGVNTIVPNAILDLNVPPDYLDSYDPTFHLLLPQGEPSKFAGQPVALLLARGNRLRTIERAAALCSESVTFSRSGPVALGQLQGGEEVTLPLECKKGKVAAAGIIEKAKALGGEAYITGKFEKESQAHFYMEPQSTLVVPDEDGVTCHVAAQGPDFVQKCVCATTGLKQSKVAVKFRRVGGGFGGKLMMPGVLSAISAQCALKTRRAVRLVLPRETDMAIVGGRQEMEATWEVAVDPATGKLQALSYDVWLAHGQAEDMQKIVAHMIPAALDEVYGIPSIAATIHLARQHLPQRTAVRAPGHFEATLLMEAVFDGVASRLKLPGHVLRERNFMQGKMNKSGLQGGLLPQGHLDGYSNLALWSLLKSKTNFEQRAQAVEEFNAANVWKKRGIALTPARYGMCVTPGNTARVDVFRDGSVQIAVTGAEIGQGLHTKVAQLVATQFERELGASPPISCIRFVDTSTEQNPNGTVTGGSTTSEACMFAAGDAVRQLVPRLKPWAKKASKLKSEEKSKDGFWFDIIATAFSLKFLGIPQNLSAVGVHMTVPTEMMYETYGVAASEVELDVLTGESRVRFAHLMFDIGMSYNPMVDIGQMEGAFIMGMGQCTTEGFEFDKATGKLLTTNTWKYKPPIACDLPEEFAVDLLDMRKQRLDNPVLKGVKTCAGGLLGCLGVPWASTKTSSAFKSSKAIGEPPVLLASSVQSAMHAAVAAATGGPLPACQLPMPHHPLRVLPLLEGQKPGSGSVSDNASTATGTSAASAAY